MQEGKWWRRSALICAIGLGLVMGCGDDDEASLECVGDLVEVRENEEGALECVAKTHDCADGEVVTPLGQCAEADVFCGEGTALDSSSGRCVDTSEVTCGEGTVAEDGRCVVEDPLVCGAGTVLHDGQCVVSEEACGPGSRFDAPYCEIDADEACQGRAQLDVASGECVDDQVVECGPDTVEVNQECLPEGTVADDLAADADVEQGDGQPIATDAGEMVVFAGVLEDVISHTFTLDAEAGQWVEITLLSRGLPSPGFELSDGESWSRMALASMASQPTRTVLIPESGSYDLTIETSSTATAGDRNWGYVGTVEVLDAPDDYDWDVFEESLDGDLALTTHNWIRADVGDDLDEVMLTVQGAGDDAWDPTVEVWASESERWSQEELERGSTISVPTQGEETLWFHFDAQAFVGPDSDYSVSAQATSIVDPGDSHEVDVTAEAGEVIIASHQSNGSQAMDVVVERSGEEVASLEDVPASGQSYGADETYRPFIYAAEGGTHTVRYTNAGDEVVDGFVGTASTESAPTFEVADSGLSSFNHSFDGDLYEPGDWQYVVIDAASQSNLDVSVTVGDGEVQAALYDGQRFAVASEEEDVEEAQLEWLASQAQPLVLAIKPASDITEGIDVAVEAEVFDGLGPAEVIEETVTMSTNDVFRARVTPFEGDALDVTLENPNGVVIFEAEEIEEPLEIAEVAAGPGDYTLTVSNPGFMPVLIGDVTVQAMSPFEIYDVDEVSAESFSRDALDAGEREVMLLRFLEDEMLSVGLEADEGDATLRVLEPGQGVVGEVSSPEELTLAASAEFGALRVVEVVADSDLSEGYELSLGELSQFEVEETSSPGIAIPDNDPDGITDEISVSNCPTIVEVEVTVDITHTWRGDLIVDVTSPTGQTANLQDRTGGSADDLQATYPFPDGTGYDDGEELLDLEGTNGTGTWEIFVSDNAALDTGDLNSWTLHLLCEG